MRFPWSSAPERPKPAEQKLLGPKSPPQVRAAPVVEVPVFGKLKRARLDDDTSDTKQIEKRTRRPPVSKSKVNKVKGIDTKDGALVEQQLRNEEGRSKHARFNHVVDEDTVEGSSMASPVTTDRSLLTPLQQSIEAQFSLEILLKHQELRLIEQELAKCQVAYEQLRRCRLVPYSELESASLCVDAVEEPAVRTEQTAESLWAAHRSVTEGPYTRHYRRWLIPDSRFDGATAQEDTPPSSAGFVDRVSEGRTTRGSFPESAATAGKSRLRGGVAASKMQPSANGFASSREKAGPLILKRSSDGEYVKLVCLDCERGDFSSAQGFINHCRIAHHRGFESHDAAAIACGQIVEMDETGHVVGEGDGGSGGTVALVHPLIRSAPTMWTTTSTATASPSSAHGPGDSTASAKVGLRNPKDTRKIASRATKARHRPARGQGGNRSKAKVAASFIPSPQTPHLSALMQNKGLGGNLGEMVGEAKTKYDLGVFSSSEDDEYEDEEQAEQQDEEQGRRIRRRHDGGSDDDAPPMLRGSRMPSRAGVSPAPLGQTSSSKGFEPRRKAGVLGGSSARSSRLAPSQTTPPNKSRLRSIKRGDNDDVVMLPPPVMQPDLSPNALDSATAPSLVSDDGEYEAHSDSESPGSEEADDAGYGVEFDVEDGDEAGHSDETMATDPDLEHPSTPAAKEAIPRRTALRKNAGSVRETRKGREERHVTFMSPVKDPEPKGRGVRRSVRK